MKKWTVNDFIWVFVMHLFNKMNKEKQVIIKKHFTRVFSLKWNENPSKQFLFFPN